MVKNIGLLDYDVVSSRRYIAPNYDIGIIYNYLKQDRNLNVRLISSTSQKNLEQYDKIYVFKQSKLAEHPSSTIKDYYKLPIEEYGPGFIDKPIRPFLAETRHLSPDCSCYNNMILFSLSKPKNRIAWKINRNLSANGKRQPIRLYEKIDGEELKKDYPTQKNCLLYDDPVDILNNREKWKYYTELKNNKHNFLFAQALDISRVKDTNILEQVIESPDYTEFRRNMMASELNDNIEWLVNKIMSEEQKKLKTIRVKLSTTCSEEECFEALLIMNYYNHKTKFRLKLVPAWNNGYLGNSDFAQLAIRYLLGRPHVMSYYEYVFNISYLREGVPKELIHIGEDLYERIFSQYGMSTTLTVLEDWLRAHPHFEEHIFIGGSSNYEKQRRKYYDKGRGGFNIKSSVDVTSS